MKHKEAVIPRNITLVDLFLLVRGWIVVVPVLATKEIAPTLAFAGSCCYIAILTVI